MLIQGNGSFLRRLKAFTTDETCFVISPSVWSIIETEATDWMQQRVCFQTKLLTLKNVDYLAKQIAQCQKNFRSIVAVGGGSVIDAVKIWRKSSLCVQFVAVPTTVGTGSEATSFATYYNRDGEKMSLDHSTMLPDDVILDESLCRSLPKSVILATGLDALCHAVESFWAIQATPESRKYSMLALKLIIAHFERALDGDQDALAAMQKAAYFGGQAINIAKTTLAHALSYSLTAQCGVPHGHAAAAHLSLVAQYNEPCLAEESEHLRQMIDIGAQSLSAAIKEFIDRVGGTSHVADFPVSCDDLHRCLVAAQSSKRSANNPRQFDLSLVSDLVLRRK